VTGVAVGEVKEQFVGRKPTPKGHHIWFAVPNSEL
jgi:hypothetical protein